MSRAHLIAIIAVAIGSHACGGERAAPPPAAPVAAAPPSWCQSVPRAAFAGLDTVATGSEWFRAYRVGTGVIAITEPFQFQEVISYLILGRTGALLFDSGLGIGPMATVVRELTPLPVTVLNSHTHYDHVGGNADFDRVLAVDDPYTRVNSAGFPHRIVAGEVAAEAFCRPAPAGFDPAGYSIRTWTAAEWIRDGHRIELGDRTIEVLRVPGHTPDAVALLDRAAGLLWTGDSFYEAPIWLFVPETDLEGYQQSMTRLAALAPSLNRVYGSHNLAISEPARLGEVVAAVAAIRAGTAARVDKGNGQVEFSFGRFSILTSKDVLEGKIGPRDQGGSGLPVSP